MELNGTELCVIGCICVQVCVHLCVDVYASVCVCCVPIYTYMGGCFRVLKVFLSLKKIIRSMWLLLVVEDVI